jgi:hypothetical protein
VTTPLDTAAQRRFCALQDDQSSDDATFYSYLFSLEEMASFLQSAGFDVDTTAPISRHYAMSFPRLCLLVRRYGLPDGLAARILTPILRMRRDAWMMAVAIGRKPR